MCNTNLPPEQLSILNRCFHPSGTFIEFKKEEIEQSIPDRFEEQVRKNPQRLAVKTRLQELTYDELNGAANRVAHFILEGIGEGPERVALFFEQSSTAIASVLGALKAGKTYVALDRSLPADRLKYILDNSGASLVLTNDQNYSAAADIIHQNSKLLNIDDSDSGISSGDPQLSISPGSPAFITYTSGSSGNPKGAVHSHRNALHGAIVDLAGIALALLAPLHQLALVLRPRLGLDRLHHEHHLFVAHVGALPAGQAHLGG